MKYASSFKLRSILALLSLVFFMWSCPAYSAETLDIFHPAKVKNISDRAYEPAVIELLDNAKDSIVLSMYILKPAEEGPVNLLVKDLVEALDRGVSVTIYLNTRFKSKEALEVLERKSFKHLKKKGAKIYHFHSKYRVHDKLIIVDSRYVVEGSANWSVSALKTNYESATLIDSPELAQVKLRRLESMPLTGSKTGEEKKSRKLKKIGVLPKNSLVEIKNELLEDKNLFPRMVKDKSGRSMDTYFLLLAESESASRKKEGFDVSLEDIAFTLKMPDSWSDTAKRRQVIKVLRTLKDKYKLIDFECQHGDDAWIMVKELPGETFTIKGDFFDSDYLASKSASGQFVMLLKDLLKEEGKTLDSFSQPELTKRFHVKYWGLRTGREEIEEGRKEKL